MKSPPHLAQTSERFGKVTKGLHHAHLAATRPCARNPYSFYIGESYLIGKHAGSLTDSTRSNRDEPNCDFRVDEGKNGTYIWAELRERKGDVSACVPRQIWFRWLLLTKCGFYFAAILKIYYDAFLADGIFAVFVRIHQIPPMINWSLE